MSHLSDGGNIEKYSLEGSEEIPTYFSLPSAVPVHRQARTPQGFGPLSICLHAIFVVFHFVFLIVRMVMNTLHTGVLLTSKFSHPSYPCFPSMHFSSGFRWLPCLESGQGDVELTVLKSFLSLRDFVHI